MQGLMCSCYYEHMQAYVILGVLLGLPLVIGLVFRTGTQHIFLALLSGELLVRYFKDDAETLLSTFGASKPLIPYIGLIILALPIVLTAIFLHHTLSKGKLFFHVIPMAITGVVFAAFAIDLLPESLRTQLTSSHYGRVLDDSKEIVIGAMVALQLIAMWLFNRSSKEGKHK